MTDPFWGYVNLLIGNDVGNSGDTTITDQSLRNRTITNVASHVFYASAPPPPTGLATTLVFQAAGRLEASSGLSYWLFGSNEFCIEGFLRLPMVANSVVFAD